MKAYRIIAVSEPVGRPDYKYFIQRKVLWMWFDVRHLDDRVVGDGVLLSRLTWFDTLHAAEAWVMERGTMPKRHTVLMEFLR